MMNDIWEPWTPELGQRVLIRVSPECGFHALHDEDGYPVERIQWTTGTVTGVHENTPGPGRGHHIRVRFDDEVGPFGDFRKNETYWWGGGLFAAVELVPL